jgi:hypothetical protein
MAGHFLGSLSSARSTANYQNAKRSDKHNQTDELRCREQSIENRTTWITAEEFNIKAEDGIQKHVKEKLLSGKSAFWKEEHQDQKY